MTNAEAKRELRYMFSPVYAEELINALSEPTIPLSVIEKIKANIDKLPDLNPDYPMDMTTHVSKWAVFEIIDKAVKEYTHE